MGDYGRLQVVDGPVCERCGLERTQWRTLGVLDNGDLCCCAGCAEESGCACVPEPSGIVRGED